MNKRVYVIQDGRYVKVGLAANPIDRMAQLQTGNPRPLRLLNVMESHDPCVHEKRIQDILVSRKASGEWYVVNDYIIDILTLADTTDLAIERLLEDSVEGRGVYRPEDDPDA